MNPFIIEQKRIELLNSLPNSFGMTKLWLLFDFYKTLIEANNQILFEAYADEFLDDFITELNHCSTFYQTPKLSESLIELTNKLASNCKSLEKKNELTRLTNDLNISLKTLKSILDGNNVAVSSRISFPLIEKSKNQQTENTLGILESVKIKISKAKAADSFLIIPSQQKMDELLEKQIKTSFYFALKYLADNYGKVKSHHELIIYFENRSACYEGNSLGIALTIGFIEELTKFYNLPYLVHIKENITSTGGIEANGIVIPIAGNHIQNKVEIIFYSPVEFFILPKVDEPKAREKLLELKENYPNRNLNLIPVENIEELLDRRSLIEIKKQPIVFRTAKFLKQNWIATILLLILTLILIFIFVKDWDDNPSAIDFHEKELLVKNKLGKILWTLPLQNDEKSNRDNNVNYQQYRIIDINNDGVNEVLVSYEAKELAESEYGRIACYDKNKTRLWKFSLNDSVSTEMEKFSPDFTLQLFDTTTRKGIKELYLTAAHASSNFPSAICRVNLLTGDQIPGVFWHAGRIGDGVIVKKLIVNKKTLVACFINNGFKQIGLFQMDLENLNGQAPTDEIRTFIGIPAADLSNYILTPNSDYNKHFGLLYPKLFTNSIQDSPERKKIVFTVLEGIGKTTTSIAYEFTYDFSKVDIVTSSDFEKARDSLVINGSLKPPKTYTNEYQEKLKSGIMRWTGRVFEYPYKKSR